MEEMEWVLLIRPYLTAPQVGISFLFIQFTERGAGEEKAAGFVLSYKQTSFSYFSCIFLLLVYLIMELVAYFYG
tara:strand:- start:1942 stop:2163 length:222 start_codon:yes stop_codon:yes gene_type:complete